MDPFLIEALELSRLTVSPFEQAEADARRAEILSLQVVPVLADEAFTKGFLFDESGGIFLSNLSFHEISAHVFL
jgi:hypothetical protein